MLRLGIVHRYKSMVIAHISFLPISHVLYQPLAYILHFLLETVIIIQQFSVRHLISVNNLYRLVIFIGQYFE